MILVVIPRRFAVRPGIRVHRAWLPEVERVCNRFDLLVSSGYRTVRENQNAGGARNSDHLRGDACDFIGNPGKVLEAHQWAEHRYPYVEPMSEAHDHLHISFRHNGRSFHPPPNRKGIRPLSGLAFTRALWNIAGDKGIDPVVMAAVGSTEGASGRIGDGGGSYGPWQLNIAGALPAKWKARGRHNPQTNAWAWSRGGIRYVVDHLVQAGMVGLHGGPAIHTMVYDFEKPRDKPREYETSLTRYHEALAYHGGPRQWTAERFLGPVGGGGGGGSQGGQEGGGLDHGEAGAAGAPWRRFVHILSRTLPDSRAYIHNTTHHIDRGGRG